MMLSSVYLAGSLYNPKVKSFTDATGGCTSVDHCDCENNCTGNHRMASPTSIMPLFRHIILVICKNLEHREILPLKMT